MGIRHLPDFVIGGAACVAAWLLWRWSGSWSGRTRTWIRPALAVGCLLVLIGSLLGVTEIARMVAVEFFTGARAAAIGAAAALLYGVVAVWALHQTERMLPSRRMLLRTATAAAIAAPVAVACAAYLKREELVFREASVFLPGLPRDLDGLRIVQISDLHLSPLVSEKLVERSVAMANEAKAHFAVVTGDLISVAGDPLDTCLKHMARLKSDGGIYACMGNHEYYAEVEAYSEREGERLGIRFLRHQAAQLRFGNARLTLSGVDYQPRDKPYLVKAEDLIEKDTVNILLSHNPDVFPVAARKGFDLTLAGHTHGGQINFEMIHPSLNVVKLLTPYVYGTYEKDGRWIYVTRGVGTIGVPARLGAPPEVAVIRLCAT